MKVAIGSFVRKGEASNLPDVFIEKVKILPTNFETGKQPVEVVLSLQTTLDSATLYTVPYMVFVGFAKDNKTIKKMMRSENLVKSIIRTPRRPLGSLVKRYLNPPVWSEDNKPVIVPLGSRADGIGPLAKLSLTLTEEFDIEELDNLNVYATAYARDLQATSKSGVERKIIAMKMSPPACEVIMRHGQTPLTTMAYVLEEDVEGYGLRGEVWGGPMHAHKGTVMAGAHHSETKHPTLKMREVSNQKIQDLRFMNDIAKLQFTASKNKSQVVSRRQRRDLEVAAKVVKTPSTVSDCTYSRTMDNKLKISFAIDYDRMVKENTRLGYFIRNSQALQSCFQIENIRIYRRRVYPNLQPNELTPGKINICGSNVALSPEKLIGSLKAGTIQAVNFAGTVGGVRNFVATDESMSHEHRGDFEYKVCIDIVDSTITAASRTSADLVRELSEYNKFLAAADSMGAKGFNIKERIKRDKKFLKAMNKEWQSLINTYMTAVTFFFGTSAFGQMGSLAWRKNLIAMANPLNGDIRAMRRVSELVAQFNDNLKMLFAPATTPTSATAFSLQSRISSQSSTKRKVLLEHVFRSNYERRTSAATGTDYLDYTLITRNDATYTSMTYDTFLKRINNEMDKYKVPRPNDPGINKFGFLSPARLFSGGSVVDTSTAKLAQKVANGILNASLAPDLNADAFVPSNTSEKVYNEEINSILGFSDIAMTPNTKPLSELVTTPKPTQAFTIGAGFFLNPGPAGTSFIKNDNASSTRISGSNLNTMRMQAAPAMRMNSSLAAAFFVNRAASGFRAAPAFNPMPNLKGSLAAEAAAQEPDNTELNSSFGNSVNFNSIVEVQYLDGYVVTNGVINLNAPIWRTLTKSVYEKNRQEKIVLLCRILATTPSMKMENLYALPEYDSLFLLGEPAGTSPSSMGTPESWRTLLAGIQNELKTDMKNVALNIEDNLGNIDGAYIGMPVMIKEAHPRGSQNTQNSLGGAVLSTGAPGGGSY